MHHVLDDIATWFARGARADVVARVQCAARGDSVEAERIALARLRHELLLEASQRRDIPPYRDIPGARLVSFRAENSRIYTLDFAAHGSDTPHLPCSRRFTLVTTSA